jgi:hypothetical protein
MLTATDYLAFRRILRPKLSILSDPIYDEYVHYEQLWQDYIMNMVYPTLSRLRPKKIGIIAMESAPGGLPHPHANYIFTSVNNVIGPKDSYLKAFFNGSQSLSVNHSQGLTKRQCLDGLLGMVDRHNVSRPLVLLDLFPSHGIKLDTNKRKLLAGISKGVLHPLVSAELQNRLHFIHVHLLNPIGFTWNRVHFKFACPPTSQSAAITALITRLCPGVNMDPVNINTIGNGITPSANTLRNSIFVGGF